MSNNPSPKILARPHANFRSILTFTAATLLLIFLWQFITALGFLQLAGGIPTEATVFSQMSRWQPLQQFGPWSLLFILLLLDDSPSTKIARLLPFLVTAAIAAISLEILFSLPTGILLPLTILLLALRHIYALARAGAAITIQKLYSLLALQWLFLWAGADAYFRLYRHSADPSSSARSLLFLLPAIGLLPNLLTAAALHLYPTLLTPTAKPRLRAWLLALLLLNAGSLLTILGHANLPFSLHTYLPLLGLPLMLLALPLFLLGFPKNTFQKSARLLAFPFLFLALPLSLLFLERLKIATSSDPVPFFYSEAWRHLLAATPILFLLTLAHLAHSALLPKKIQSPALTLLALLLFLAGTGLNSTFLFAATFSHNYTQALPLGSSLQLLSLLLALPLTLRSIRAAKI